MYICIYIDPSTLIGQRPTRRSFASDRRYRSTDRYINTSIHEYRSVARVQG